MAHEELKKQFEKDRKIHGNDAFRLWEYQDYGCSVWEPCWQEPYWQPYSNYRRKEQPFEPEYFSGLNWRDAACLVGKKVECSNDGDNWTGPFELKILSIANGIQHFQVNGGRWTYIRTTPETHCRPHPTITLTVNGQEWVLPKPETEPPGRGVDYWIVDTYETDRYKWQDGEVDKEWLEIGIVHLTEARAQAWADLWREGILAAVK